MRPEARPGPLKVSVKRPVKKWSKDEVLRNIRALEAKGKKLSAVRMVRLHPRLYYAGRQYFGSWERTIKAAGIDYDSVRRYGLWSRARIIEQIKELRKAGRPLSPNAAKKNCCSLFNAAIAHFGSWRRAIEAAGLDYTKVKLNQQWSPKAVVQDLKRYAKGGFDRSSSRAAFNRYLRLRSAAIRQYGNWSAAMKAAGLGRSRASRKPKPR